MPTRTLKIDGTTGQVGIVNYGNAANAFADPSNNIADVFFHTSLPYLQLKGTVEATVTFGVAARAYYSWDDSSGCGGGC